MKIKHLFLTLMMTILCTVQGWADIQEGYYYLKFGHSSVTPSPALYLATVYGHQTDSKASTQTTGSVFYIEKGSIGYTFKSGGQYLSYSTWNVTLSNGATEWPVEEVGGVANAYYIKGYDNKVGTVPGYLGNSNSSNFAADKSVFSNAGKTDNQGANYWILIPAEINSWMTLFNTVPGEWSNVSGGQCLPTISFNEQTVNGPNDLADNRDNYKFQPIVLDGITLTAGENVIISWTGNDNLKNTYIQAYLDANKNFVFTDANEKLGAVGTEGAENASVQTGSINFTVPNVLSTLTTRIRIRVDGAWHNGNKPSSLDPDANTNRIVYDIPVTINPVTPPTETPASIAAMLERIGGAGASNLITAELDESIAEGGKEVYIIMSKNGKPHVKGSTLSAISAGIGYYLNHYAKVNLTWNNLTTNLSAVSPLPVPTSEDKHVCTADYRYYLNYCTFSYSMSTWTWDRWQKEIDWMALHGINLPLQLVGIDAVWYKVLTQDYGFTHDEANEFVAGPCYQGWWLMNNIVAHGGPNPQWWYEREATLGKHITDRMRELGMSPCLPGFVGMVPEKLATAKSAQVHTGSWCSMNSPQILRTGADQTTKDAFAEIAANYYKRLYEVYDFKPDYYGLDPMHEREASQISNYSDANYKSICDEARKAMNLGRDVAPVWVAQEWQVNAAQSRINALPSEKTLLLDLSSERETYKTRFTGKDYVFCMLHNYGGNIGMYGCIDRLLNEYKSQRTDYSNLKGVGATPEGIETNPVLYELLFELPWLSSVPNATDWINEYTECRYNASSDKAKTAWNLLHNTVYNQNSSKQQGCVEPVILARPNLRGATVSRWSQSSIDWNKEDVQRAAWEILEAEIPENINYNYDLVDITRQALADYAHSLQIDLGNVKTANGISSAEFISRKDKYMSLIDDTDELLGTIEDFRLGRWLSSARQIAIDAGHSESADWLEKNARWLITTWAPTSASCNGGNLYDYGNREYQGLITGYYKPRWEDFFDNKSATEQNGEYWFNQEIRFVNGESVPYGTYQGGQATGNAKATAQRILGKYIYRVTNVQGDVAYLNAAMVNNNKTFTDNAILGTPYSPNITLPDGVTLTSARLSDDQKPGIKKATIELSDGTIATYNVALRTQIDEPRTVSVVKSVTGGTATVAAEGATPVDADGKLSVISMNDIVATATAADGYEFEKWVNESDEEVSKDNPYYHYAAENIALTPVFVVSKWAAVECLNNDEFSTMTGNKQYIAEFSTVANDEEYSFFSTTEVPTKYYMIVPSVVQLVRGVNNTIKWTAADQQGQSNGMQACRFNGYIDVNSDGDFTDDGEYMPTKGSYKAQNSEMHSASVSFMIPESAPLGRTRMRLRYDGAWQGSQFKMEATEPAGRMVYDVPVDIVEYPYYPVNVGASSSNTVLGTIRVDGGAFNNQNPAVIAPGSTVILLAEPTDGSTFLGWKNVESGKIENTDLRWEFRPTKDLTYQAVFAGTKVPEPDKSSTRPISSLTITGADDTELLKLTGSYSTRYNDLYSTNTLIVSQRQVIKVAVSGPTWMNAATYIDENGNGFCASEAPVDINAHTVTTPSELKTYSAYQFGGTTFYDDQGNTLSDGNKMTMNSFRVPAATGTYRMRVKTDYNNIDPTNFKHNDGVVIDIKLIVQKDNDLDFDPALTYTLKTGSPDAYFTCGNSGIMGKSSSTPTYQEIDAFLWKVVGDNNDGYTLQNKYTNEYVQDPATNEKHAKVRMTSNPSEASKFKFVNGVFQLVSNPEWYLASYSVYDNYVAINNSSTFSGSKITKLAMEKVPTPTQGQEYVYQGNGSVGLLKAADYITNVDGEGNKKYTKVPTGKSWQMVMDVIHQSGQTESYNEYGSCILSSEMDPINTQYWNNFQVFEHSAARGTLNFKSNKGDGMDHVIAQGHKVYTSEGYENYRVFVRYDGNYTYLIRTIILDNNGDPTDQVFNNVWFAARVQNDIDVMSCALPTGTNLKSLAISIAEESNLMEDVDYAIQNITTKDYLIGANYIAGSTWYSQNAGDAAHYQIEWTNNNDLTYTETDGGLHNSFYIKLIDDQGKAKYLGPDNTNVNTKGEALAYIYSENAKKVQPITAKETLGEAWKITAQNADTWLWDFFANFYVEVAGNNNGGLNYTHAGEKRTATNGEYVMLPSGVDEKQLANSSQLGYMAAISKADIRLKVQYTPLNNTFYNITSKTIPSAQPVLYYWFKDRVENSVASPTLVTYSNGNVAEWGETGDCSKFSIAKATTIPVKFNQNTAGNNPDQKFYGTIYSPNALVLPDGVSAYAAKDNGNTMRMNLIANGGEILPAKTGAILRCDEYTDPVDFTLNTTDNSYVENNDLDGTFITFENPKDNTYYTLSGKNGIGFYKYTGANLNGFKAFYHSNNSQARLAFDFDDPTGIEDLQCEEVNSVVYDLQGRRVNNITKGGIYIVNGKKVMK